MLAGGDFARPSLGYVHHQEEYKTARSGAGELSASATFAAELAADPNAPEGSAGEFDAGGSPAFIMADLLRTDLYDIITHT